VGVGERWRKGERVEEEGGRSRKGGGGRVNGEGNLCVTRGGSEGGE